MSLYICTMHIMIIWIIHNNNESTLMKPQATTNQLKAILITNKTWVSSTFPRNPTKIHSVSIIEPNFCSPTCQTCLKIYPKYSEYFEHYFCCCEILIKIKKSCRSDKFTNFMLTLQQLVRNFLRKHWCLEGK